MNNVQILSKFEYIQPSQTVCISSSTKFGLQENDLKMSTKRSLTSLLGIVIPFALQYYTT